MMREDGGDIGKNTMNTKGKTNQKGNQIFIRQHSCFRLHFRVL